jgi:Uma2 family endonuclease
LGIFASDKDYRVPDVVVYSDEAAAERGVDRAPEVVVEVRSPGDESYEKLPWYLARVAVMALLITDRDSLALDLYAQSGRAEPKADGSVVLEPLGVSVVPRGGTLVVDGAELEI